MGMDKYFHTTIYNLYNYFSMLGLKLIHVSKGVPGGVRNQGIISHYIGLVSWNNEEPHATCGIVTIIAGSLAVLVSGERQRAISARAPR